jgi:hypothetical protein
MRSLHVSLCKSLARHFKVLVGDSDRDFLGETGKVPMSSGILKLSGAILIYVLYTCTCGEGDGITRMRTKSVKLYFTDNRIGEYEMSTVRNFAPFNEMMKMLEGINVEYESIPLGIRKEIFDIVVRLCNGGEIPDLDRDTFYEVLRVIDYLTIEEEKKKVSFRNLAIKSFFGLHSEDIIYSMNERVVGCNTYLRFMEGFASVIDMEVRIFGMTATICKSNDEWNTEYGDTEGVGAASYICKIKIGLIGNFELIDQRYMKMLVWFARSMNLRELTLQVS